MRYDPDDKSYFYNTEMVLSDEAAEDIRAAHYANAHDILSHPISRLRQEQERNNGGAKLSGGQIILSFAIIAAFILMIIMLIMGYFPIATWIISVLLGLLGIVLITTAKTSNDAKSYIQAPFVKIGSGLVFILAAAGAAYLNINSKFFTTNELFVGAFVIVLGSGTLFMFLQFLGQLLSPNMIYTEEINATVTGYLRTYESSGDNHLHMVNSPVFEYYFEGEQISAAYDTFNGGRNGKIPVGSSAVIRIDPKNPDHIMGNTKSLARVFGIITFACLAFTVVLLVLIATDKVNDGQVRFSGLAAAKYDRMISDSLVTESFGPDWYIEKAHIATIEERTLDDLTYLHIKIDDPSFKEIDAKEFDWKAGEEVYIIYSMEDVDGTLKKKPLQFVSAEGTGYTGSHKAYAP